MTIAQISDYQNRLAGLPADRFIGSILWYSITGTIDRVTGNRIQVPVRVTRDQLEAWFLEFGLDTQFLPPQILKVDAFRKATGKATREYELPDGRCATLYVDEIDSTNDYVERHVLRRIVDPRQQQDEDKHQTEWMATIKFFRGGRSGGGGKRASGDHYKTRVKIGLPAQDANEVDSLLGEVQKKYDDLAANLNEDKIRGVVRNYLAHLNAIAVKPSGAVYFVHSTKQAALDALQALVHRIGQGCSMEQIPLIDTENSRQILTDAFQAEVEDDVRLLLAEIAELNAKAGGKPISPTLYAKINEKYQAVQSRSEEYTDKLGLAQGKAAAALEMALDQVMDLAQRTGGK